MAHLQANSIPPLFTLAQADGSRFELAKILGRDRILIAFFPTLGWLREIASRQAELHDYELQVLALVAPQVLAEAPTSSDWLHIGAAEAAILEDLGVRLGEPLAFLVGKDRGVKKVCVGDADLDALLALIDTMPMRQAEIERAE